MVSPDVHRVWSDQMCTECDRPGYVSILVMNTKAWVAVWKGIMEQWYILTPKAFPIVKFSIQTHSCFQWLDFPFLGQMTLISVHFYDAIKVFVRFSRPFFTLYFFSSLLELWFVYSLPYDLIQETIRENSDWPQDSREIMFLHFAKTCSLPRKGAYMTVPQSSFAHLLLKNGAKRPTLTNYNTLSSLRDRERKIFTQATWIGYCGVIYIYVH